MYHCFKVWLRSSLYKTPRGITQQHLTLHSSSVGNYQDRMNAGVTKEVNMKTVFLWQWQKTIINFDRILRSQPDIITGVVL